MIDCIQMRSEKRVLRHICLAPFTENLSHRNAQIYYTSRCANKTNKNPKLKRDFGKSDYASQPDSILSVYGMSPFCKYIIRTKAS